MYEDLLVGMIVQGCTGYKSLICQSEMYASNRRFVWDVSVRPLVTNQRKVSVR